MNVREISHHLISCPQLSTRMVIFYICFPTSWNSGKTIYHEFNFLEWFLFFTIVEKQFSQFFLKKQINKKIVRISLCNAWPSMLWILCIVLNKWKSSFPSELVRFWKKHTDWFYWKLILMNFPSVLFQGNPSITSRVIVEFGESQGGFGRPNGHNRCLFIVNLNLCAKFLENPLSP